LGTGLETGPLSGIDALHQFSPSPVRPFALAAAAKRSDRRGEPLARLQRLSSRPKAIENAPIQKFRPFCDEKPGTTFSESSPSFVSIAQRVRRFK
jgi:hypothetical protein